MIDIASKNAASNAIRAAFPYTIPVLTGFITLGMAYGILMRESGYNAVWSAATSAIAYCGSMQFAAISLLTAEFNPIQAFLLSLMLNARHIFYGVSMLGKYRGLEKSRFILIYTLCDETFSILSSIEPPSNIERKHFYLAVSLLDYGYWFTGSLLGGLIGELIHFDLTGLDFMLTALFIVLLLEQIKNHKNIPAALVGIIGGFCALLIFGADGMIIAAMVIILIVLLTGRRLLDR